MESCGVLCRLLAVDTDYMGVSASFDVTFMVAWMHDKRLGIYTT